MNKQKIMLISAGILILLAIIFISNMRPTDYESLNGFGELIDLRKADESNFVEANENMLNILEQIWEKHGYYASMLSEEKFSADKKKANVEKFAGNKDSDISFLYSYDNLTSYKHVDTGMSSLRIFIESVGCDKNFTLEDGVIRDSVNLFTGLINKKLQEAEEIIDLERISKSFNERHFHGKEKVVLHVWRNGIEIKGTIKTSYNSRRVEWIHELELEFSIRSYSNKKTAI